MAGTIDLGKVSIDTKRAEDNIKRLDENIDKLDKDLVNLDKELAKVTAQNQSFSNALSKGADFLKNITLGVGAGAAAMARLAMEVNTGAIAADRQNVALRGLNGGYQAVRLATNGAVTAQQAFAAQNALTQSGLRVSSEQLATITRAAREFALRTGTDSAQAVQQLTAALVAGDAQAMRPFGINVQVGTLRTQAFRQALGQLGNQQRNTAASAQTLAEETDRLGRAWEAYKNDVSAALAETLNFKSAIHELADAFEALVDGGPLVHNFFSGILEDITGIQHARQGTAEDRGRNNDQLSRERAIAALERFRGVPGIDVTGFNANALSGPAAERLSRALSSGTADPVRIQAEIDRARGITRVQAADRTARLAAAASGTTPAQAAQNAADDLNERTRNMSAMDQFQLAEDQRQAREQVDSKIRELQSVGVRVNPALRARLYGLIGGFLVPLNRSRFAREMAMLEGQSRGLSRGTTGLGGVQSRYGQGLTNQQYLDLAAADRDKVGAAAEMGRTIGAINRAGSRYAGDSVLLGGSSTDTLFDRFGRNLSADTYAQLAEAEQGKAGARAEMGQTIAALGRRNDLSQQVGSFFSDTQTLAEKGAKGVEGAFNSMSGAVSGFIDTLIEGQVPAGEAAVGLAKAALKGLAMQAVPEALFETAKGFAALATGDPRAALHFTSAGIFAGIAVAAGAGAAGISAAQRGAAPSASASTPAAQYTPLGGSSGGQQQGGGTVIFNINSTVFDPERAEETVARLQRGANARGL